MIHWFEPSYWGNEKKYVNEALDSTWISGGDFVDRLEQSLAEILNVPYVISVSNGTTALLLALLLTDLQPQEEVIVPGFSFAAPANMVLAMQGKPVFVDVCPDTWCLDPDKIEAAITPKTRAIIPVHTYGNVCAMNRILDIAKQYDLAVIEDSAESLFSKYGDQMSGTLGDIGCYSFQATKTITTGEGGCIAVHDKNLMEKARLFRNHGMQGNRRYWHHVVGHNFRLTNLQAALGCAQLEAIHDIVQHKSEVYYQYYNQLADCPSIKMQKITEHVEPLIWAVAFELLPNSVLSRDALRDKLNECGIETRPGFYAYSEMPIYNCPSLTESTKLASNIISVPSYPKLSMQQITLICHTIKELLT